MIVAAGRSERMDGTDKVFAQLMGRPLIAWTLAAFKRCDAIEGVVVVAAPDAVERMRARAGVALPKVTDVVAGARRGRTPCAGLEAANGAAIVAVHDGARPLVTPALIDAGSRWRASTVRRSARCHRATP